MPNNIFLDFLNRDSRQIYGLFEATKKSTHIKYLIEAINISVLLCDEYCIVPPGFIAECPFVWETLERRLDYLSERVIRLPMRESSFDDFFIKKQREYQPFQDLYSGLFDNKKIESFLKKAPSANYNKTIDNW
jgi:hypothetical protein